MNNILNDLEFNTELDRQAMIELCGGGPRKKKVKKARAAAILKAKRIAKLLTVGKLPEIDWSIPKGGYGTYHPK